MTKKEALEVPPLLHMFESILREHNSDGFNDSTDWRDCKYGLHVNWIGPLVRDALIREVRIEPAWKEGEDRGDRQQFNYHYFAITDKGFRWWLSEYTKEIEDRTEAYKKLVEPFFSSPSQLDGKGIGAVLRYDFQWGPPLVRTAMAAIEDGYFAFHSFHYYPRGFEKSIEVTLTAKGMLYFDSIPRLMEVC